MPITPKISSALQKKYQWQVAISYWWKILGIWKTWTDALKKARKNDHNIENKSFLVSRIRTGKEVIIA